MTTFNQEYMQPQDKHVTPLPPSTGPGYRFQVNLQAMIDLLSNHLYTGPQVFARELLQNAVDALRAREALEPAFRGEVTVEAVPGRDGNPPTLVFEDNGVGLTLDEIHTFLATIGSSSKREDLEQRRTEYIGQFGIGLLSCFLVTDEIVVVTRSAKPNQPTLEWRGRVDGTYQISVLEREMAPGTTVFLRARSGREAFFHPTNLRDLLRHYGSLLPVPVHLVEGGRRIRVNDQIPPWKQADPAGQGNRSAYLDYGRQLFGLEFFDCIPLNFQEFGIEGAAYVLSEPPNLAGKRAHRVYLKGMLVTEQADNIVPDWAFFVRSVINSSMLRPTASREALYEDEILQQTREMLGKAFRQYLIQLSQSDPNRLRKFIQIHSVAIKHLAMQDDEFCRIFIDLLPFQSSVGEITLGEYKQRCPEIQYVTKLDEFRQLSQVAAAQGLQIINAGYAFDAPLLEAHARLYPDIPTRRVALHDLVDGLKELDLAEREQCAELLRLAGIVLQPYNCRVGARKFFPTDLPALYAASEEALFLRAADQTKQVTGPLWAGIVDRALQGLGAEGHAELCLNLSNPIIRGLATCSSHKVIRLLIQLLYVQGLLHGHHSVSPRENRLLSQSLLELIQLTVTR